MCIFGQCDIRSGTTIDARTETVIPPSRRLAEVLVFGKGGKHRARRFRRAGRQRPSECSRVSFENHITMIRAAVPEKIMTGISR
jgi:hypothetical protein